MPNKQRSRRKTDTGTWFQAQYHRNQQKRSSGRLRTFIRRFIMVVISMIFLAVTAAIIYWGRVEEVRIQGFENNPRLSDQLGGLLLSHYRFMWQAYSRPITQTVSSLPFEIRGIELKPEWTNRSLLATVTLYEPVLQWETDGYSYALDERGVVLPENASRDQLTLVRDRSNLPVQVGERASPRDLVDFAQSIAVSSLPIVELYIIDTTSELYAELETGYFIRFSTVESAESQLENVSRVQELVKQRNDAIERYIDVRIPYKAYYQ